MTSTKYLPILALDFDGVLHQYSSGWKGAAVIPDGPVPGAAEFVVNATKHFKVAIFSSRSNDPAGIEAMQAFLRREIAAMFEAEGMRPDFAVSVGAELVDELDFPTAKPPAFLTIDDRALTFDGTWPDLSELRAFQPWNKRTPADAEAQLDRLADKSELVTGAQLVALAKGPTEAMLEAARDWSAAKYGKPIGNDAARGCWAAMLGAYQTSCMAELEAFVAECDELPNPNTSLLSHNERELIGLLKRIADAIRPVV